MLFYKNILTLSILAVISVPSFAAESENVEKLETIRIKAHPLEQTSQDFAVADTVVCFWSQTKGGDSSRGRGVPDGGQVGRMWAGWGQSVATLLSARSRCPWRRNRWRSNERPPKRS